VVVSGRLLFEEEVFEVEADRRKRTTGRKGEANV
jgi:hypothetical protein